MKVSAFLGKALCLILTLGVILALLVIGVTAAGAGNEASPTDVIDIGTDEIFTLDLSGVTKDGTTTGTGVVRTGSGAVPAYALYVRVTWVYTLSDGSSFAYCAMKDVNSSLRFDMESPTLPFGAKLDAVQTALVTDPNAYKSGSYTALATASK